MDEIAVDDGEFVAPMIHGVEQLLAHAHQRRGATRCEIEAAEQFEPPRLAGNVKIGRCLVGRRRPPGGDGAIDAGAVGAEGGGERLEKGDARPGGQLRVERQDLLRQRHAGRLAAARKQRLAEFDEAGRALMRRLAALALDEGAAAFGDALQHFAEERGIQSSSHPCRPDLANNGPKQ